MEFDVKDYIKYREYAELVKEYIENEDDDKAHGKHHNKNWNIYSGILNTVSDGMFEYDINSGKIYFNNSLCIMLGVNSRVHKKGESNIFANMDENDYKKLKDIYNDLNENTSENYFSTLVHILHPSVGLKELSLKAGVIRADDGKIVKIIGTAVDKSAAKGSAGDYSPSSDVVTGLPTKKTVFSIMKNDIQRGRTSQCAVVIMDMDNFKNINDTLNPETGDKVLSLISQRLVSLVEGIGFAVRFNTDEFMVYLPHISSETQLMAICRSLHEKIREPYYVDDMLIYLTASFGAAVFPRHADNDKMLLRYADIAMQHTKQNGKDNVTIFHQEMFSSIIRRESIARAVRKGIDNNEFELYYQPQINSKTGKITGIEALLRLNSSLIGSVSPAEFIPIAEETGYIHELGKWVIVNACKTAQEFKNKGYDFGKMAINLSLVQFKKPGFVKECEDIIYTSGGRSEFIELELTETQLIEKVDNSGEIVNEMKRMGFDIALDDFGTGYSSLNHLRKLWIKTIKIDKRFIDALADDDKDCEIVRLVIDLAHCLKLWVVAEGVETEKQKDILKNMGCDSIQGYFYSRPVNKAEIEKMLIAQKEEFVREPVNSVQKIAEN